MQASQWITLPQPSGPSYGPFWQTSMQRIGEQHLPLASHTSGSLHGHESGIPQPSVVVLQPTPGSPHFFGAQHRLFWHIWPGPQVPHVAMPPQPSLIAPHCLSAGQACGLHTLQTFAVTWPQTMPAEHPPHVIEPPQPSETSPHSPGLQVVFGVHGLQTCAV